MGGDAITEALESWAAMAPPPDAWVLVVGSVDRRLTRGLGRHVLMHAHTTELVLPRESFELAIWFSTSDVPSPDSLVEIRNALARDGVLFVIDAECAVRDLDARAQHAGFSRRHFRRTAAGVSVIELQR